MARLSDRGAKGRALEEILNETQRVSPYARLCSAVLDDEFNRWFDSPWHGKSRSDTIAWLSVGASLGGFPIAGHLGPDIWAPLRGDAQSREAA